MFASMRVETTDSDTRSLPPNTSPGPLRKFDDLRYARWSSAKLLQHARMDGHEGAGENLGILHHAPALGVGRAANISVCPGGGYPAIERASLWMGGMVTASTCLQCGIDGVECRCGHNSTCFSIHASGSPVSAHFGLDIQDQRIVGPVLDEVQGMLGSILVS